MSLQDLLKQEKFTSFIDGDFLFNKANQEHSLISPTTKKHWKTVLFANQADVHAAISAAKKAFATWKIVPAPSRGEFLRKLGTLLQKNKEDLALVMAMEMGKPIKEALKEVEYAAGFYFWFAGEAERIYGLSIPSIHPNKKLTILQEPIGLCGIITPWNFPLAMGARKIAAALAAGCCVVAKPSPECPISMSAFAHLCREVDLPKGVFNVVIGPEKEVGKVLLESADIRKISFTGSCGVGRYLFRESAATLKKLTLELGGHAPLIVFDDADINKAVEGTIAAKFRNNGQTCIAANRILVQKTIAKKYLEKLLHAIQKLTIGNPLEKQTDLSTVLHPESEQKVNRHIKDALKKGATALLMGKKSYFPTVLVDVTPEMNIFYEETFGPVAAITQFDQFEEGIDLANASEYGLSAYVFTQNLQKAHLAIDQLQYGIIGLNDGLPSAPQASFGGIKNSGFGREGGPSGLREYLTEKFVSTAF